MCEAEQDRADKGRSIHLVVSMCETGCSNSTISALGMFL